MKDFLAWAFDAVVLILLMILPGIVVMSVFLICNFTDKEGGAK